MIGLYEDNPVYRLYEELNNTFTKEMKYSEIDPLLKMILINNGCKINEDNIQYQRQATLIPEKFEIYFITNIIGNDANEYYDFLIFNGKKILVIFIDYFNFITLADLNPNEPTYELKLAMGNSIYYDAIKKIVEVFYLTSEPMPAKLMTTAMVTIQRWNQVIIAANILNKFKPVDENDISEVPIDEIKEMLNKDVKLQLYGIRVIV